MATYQQLANSSFTDVVIPFTTTNGMNDHSTSLSKTLTGYTLPSTLFTFTPDVSALKGTYIGASLDKLIWDFGDGTTDVGFSVSKHYAYPGMYKVTMIITDQNGVTHRNRATQTIKVSNYISDALMWWTPTISNSAGGMPERSLCGQPSNDLTLYRYNSWQSWPVVSGDGGYDINLYSQGSRSRPLTTEQYDSGADVHYTANWRFVNSMESTRPVERIQTDKNIDVYVKVLSSGEVLHTDPSDPDCTFAGTSGYTTVNYIDDNANRLTSARPNPPPGGNLATVVRQSIETEYDTQETRDIVLYASFDTSKFPVTHYDDDLVEYDLLKQNYFQIYETQKVGLPIQVKFTTPKILSVTSNGILDFPITPNKYKGSPMSVSIRTTSLPKDMSCVEEIYPELRVNVQKSVLPTDDIVPLSSAWTAPNVAFSACDTTTDVITGQGYVNIWLSGEGSSFYNAGEAITSDADFKVWDAGAIVPLEQASSYVRLLLTDLDGTSRPYPNGRIVTLLLTQLTDHDREVLLSSRKQDYVYGTGAPRKWNTKSGREYLAYISPDSKYYQNESVSMDVIDAPLATETPGAYNCFLNLDTELNLNDFSKKYRLFVSTLIDPPLYFTYDVLYYYLANPSNDVIHQIKPVYYRTYSYGDEGFTQTYTSPILTNSPGNSGLYGFAVDPTGNMVCVDGDTDRILRHNRNNTSRDEIDIHTLLPEVSANHYPGDPDQYGYSPSSVSFSKCLDYWVTLYDAVSTIKLDFHTNEIKAVAVPPIENKLINSRGSVPANKWISAPEHGIVEVAGVQGEYGENMIQPTAVETCTNEDIIVSYTNPLCSFLARYDKDGNFLHKVDFPGKDRYFTGDICVDVSDHVWAVTEGTGLSADGSVDMNPPKGMIYSFDEELNYRLSINSVSGAEYQDMKAPVPHSWEQVDTVLLMNQYWDDTQQEFVQRDLIVDGYDPSAVNPRLILYEGNTYTFKNLFYNRGQHGLVFQEIAESDVGVIPLTASSDKFAYTGDLWTHSTTGINTDQTSDVPSEQQIAVYVDDTFPEGLLLVDYNNPENRLVLEIIKKDEIITREADTFDIINNPTFVIPDNNNNIWFSWGYRFCSRYNVNKDRVDTTVAVGSAYYDPRYDPLSAHMHDRRDNTDRRSSIEGISADTANNLLVINNADKRLYALNSDVPTLSAYVMVDNYQAPAESFTWMKSVSSDDEAEEIDFLAPSYLTDEQIRVFLKNTDQSITPESRIEAYNQYTRTVNGQNGDVRFRTSHALGPLSAVGLEQEIRACGDWTGWKWINKYDDRLVPSDNTSGTAMLTGFSDEFTLLPQVGTHDITKTGEGINFAEVIRSFMQQPSMKDREKLYDEFITGVFGGSRSDPKSLGKRVYERIENFVDNHTDIDVCTVQALHSLADMVNYKLEKLDAGIPAELTRIVDILSIKLTKLRGTVTDYQDDFEKYGNMDQKNIGVNLGSELMFVLDYDPTRSYATGDYVHYNGEFYQTKQIVRAEKPPKHKKDTKLWRHWPDGYVRARSLETMRSVYGDKGDEWVNRKYNEQVVSIKLTQNIELDITQSYVLREVFSDKHMIVRPVAISFPEFLDLKIEAIDNAFYVTDPNNRLDPENVTDVEYIRPMITADNEIVTVINTPEMRNPTINLYKNRSYDIEIHSPGNPVYITEQQGVSSTAVLGYVGNQGIEFGTMTLKTTDDPLYDPLPDRLYYMGVNDPTMSGVIQIKYVEQLPGYSTTLNGISSYNLNITVSSHAVLDALGWGMEFPEGNNAWQYYQLYEYLPDANGDQLYINNIIDWSSDLTTNTRTYEITRGFESTPVVTMSGDTYDEWTKRFGDMDVIIEKTLRDGLRFNSGVSSLSNYTTGI